MPMKRIFPLLLLLACPVTARAQDVVDDPAAIRILDRMCQVIGELESCRVTMTVARDVIDPDLGLVTRCAVDQVTMQGPDRALVDFNSDLSHRTLSYNGSQLTLYSYDENNYATIEAPPTTLELIGMLSQDYGIEFPAADIFYPTFADDLLEQSQRLAYAGMSVVDGKDCLHIVGTSDAMVVQLWVANDSFNLPVRLLFIEPAAKKNPRLDVTFTDWQLNPDLPPAIFEFLPPTTAAEVSLLPRTVK